MTKKDRMGRIGLLGASFLATAAALLFLDPIAQDPLYHMFADRREALGISNFADTVSNAAFALVGLWGLWSLLGPGGRDLFDDQRLALPFILFFIGVTAVSAGSAWYHLAPDNSSLFWDRLPMTIAFMSLFTAFLADRLRAADMVATVLPLAILAGCASLLWWDWSEAMGRGDLRCYAMIQFYPMLALPLMVLLFPGGRYTCGWHLGGIFGFYALAKLLEHFDDEVFHLLGGMVSGHSLKHLAAAGACWMVLRMITRPAARTAMPAGTAQSRHHPAD